MQIEPCFTAAENLVGIGANEGISCSSSVDNVDLLCGNPVAKTFVAGAVVDALCMSAQACNCPFNSYLFTKCDHNVGHALAKEMFAHFVE